MNLFKTKFYLALMALSMIFIVACEKEKDDNEEKETENTIDIVKPRYFTASGNKGYVSCWGNIEDWSKVNNSYIAVLDLSYDKASISTTESIYILNYGSYENISSTIDLYNETNKTIQNKAFEDANEAEYNSNAQSFSIYNGKGYLTGNVSDKIDVIDASTLEHITSSPSVSKKIELPGGPEGVIIENNKLYAALEYRDSVAVINLDNHSISYIEMPAIPQHFVKGKNGNLWVSLVSTYSDPAPEDSLGVGIIDPDTDELTGRVPFSGISGDGQLAINSDKDKIYVMGKAAYPGTESSVYEIDVAGKSIGQSALISGDNFNGIGCHPESNNIYVLISSSSQETGSLKVYDSEGTLLDTKETGVAPQEVVFYQE